MPSTTAQVDPATVIDWLAADPDAVTVLDVRTPAEFETRHIPGAYNLPLPLVGEHAEALAARLDRKVVLVRQSGVGACLTATALTDTCTMGRMLSALPDNRGIRTDPQELLDPLLGAGALAPGR